MKLAIERRKTIPVRTTTWPETRARLAASLPPAEFATVAAAYAKITGLGLAWERQPFGNQQTDKSIEGTAEVRDCVNAAASILERRGWPSPDDRAAMVNELRDSFDRSV